MRALKAYCRSPAALIGTAILLAVLVMGVGASWFYPNDPLGLAGRPLFCSFVSQPTMNASTPLAVFLRVGLAMHQARICRSCWATSTAG